MLSHWDLVSSCVIFSAESRLEMSIAYRLPSSDVIASRPLLGVVAAWPNLSFTASNPFSCPAFLSFFPELLTEGIPLNSLLGQIETVLLLQPPGKVAGGSWAAC